MKTKQTFQFRQSSPNLRQKRANWRKTIKRKLQVDLSPQISSRVCGELQLRKCDFRLFWFRFVFCSRFVIYAKFDSFRVCVKETKQSTFANAKPTQLQLNRMRMRARHSLKSICESKFREVNCCSCCAFIEWLRRRTNCNSSSACGQQSREPKTASANSEAPPLAASALFARTANCACEAPVASICARFD